MPLAPERTIDDQYPRQTGRIRRIALFGLIGLCLLPCAWCGASRAIPYVVARVRWSSHGSGDYNITLTQSGLGNLKACLFAGTNILLEVRNGRIAAVFVDGKPSQAIVPSECEDSTVDGLFDTALKDLFSPFIKVEYDPIYGYPRIYLWWFYRGR